MAFNYTRRDIYTTISERANSKRRKSSPKAEASYLHYYKIEDKLSVSKRPLGMVYVRPCELGLISTRQCREQCYYRSMEEACAH